MEVDYISIGKRVKMFRQKQGLSQETLSEMSGLTPAHFSHVETGNTKVSLPSLVSIASALDVTMDDLLADSIAHTKHVTMKEMNSLLLDCTDSEYRALLHIMKASKEAIRAHI
jgi:transcriptional regulator with XRE-family HTH domain